MYIQETEPLSKVHTQIDVLMDELNEYDEEKAVLFDD